MACYTSSTERPPEKNASIRLKHVSQVYLVQSSLHLDASVTKTKGKNAAKTMNQSSVQRSQWHQPAHSIKSAQKHKNWGRFTRFRPLSIRSGPAASNPFFRLFRVTAALPPVEWIANKTLIDRFERSFRRAVAAANSTAEQVGAEFLQVSEVELRLSER